MERTQPHNNADQPPPLSSPKRSICYGPPHLRRLRMRCNSPGSKHNPIQHHQRPNPPSRRQHLTTIPRSPPSRWMANETHSAHTKPLLEREHLQRMELQQTPNMETRAIRKAIVHRRRSHSQQKPRQVLRLSTADGRRKLPKALLQLWAYAGRAVQMYVRNPKGEDEGGGILQRRRSRVSERDVCLVAPLATANELS